MCDGLLELVGSVQSNYMHIAGNITGMALIANQSSNCARIIDSKSPMRDMQDCIYRFGIGFGFRFGFGFEFKAAQCQQTFVLSEKK